LKKLADLSGKKHNLRADLLTKQTINICIYEKLYIFSKIYKIISEKLKRQGKHPYF